MTLNSVEFNEQDPSIKLNLSDNTEHFTLPTFKGSSVKELIYDPSLYKLGDENYTELINFIKYIKNNEIFLDFINVCEYLFKIFF